MCGSVQYIFLYLKSTKPQMLILYTCSLIHNNLVVYAILQKQYFPCIAQFALNMVSPTNIKFMNECTIEVLHQVTEILVIESLTMVGLFSSLTYLFVIAWRNPADSISDIHHVRLHIISLVCCLDITIRAYLCSTLI